MIRKALAADASARRKSSVYIIYDNFRDNAAKDGEKVGRMERLWHATKYTFGEQDLDWSCEKTIERVVWIILFLAGTYLTITMSLNLIQQYKDEPLTTHLLLRKNNSMTLPIDPTMCVSTSKMYATTMWYQELYDTWYNAYNQTKVDEYFSTANSSMFVGIPLGGVNQWPAYITKYVDMYFRYAEVGWPVIDGLGANEIVAEIFKLGVTRAQLEDRWSRELQLVNESSSPTIFQEWVKAYFTENVTRETILRDGNWTTVSWKPSFTYMSLLCLNIATRVEYGASGLDDLAADGTQLKSDDRTRACIEWEKNLHARNVTTDQFRQRYGINILRLFGLLSCVSNNCDIYDYRPMFARMTCISSIELCFRLNTSFFENIPQFDGFDMNNYGYPPPQFLPFSNDSQVGLEFGGSERGILGIGKDEFNRPLEHEIQSLEDRVDIGNRLVTKVNLDFGTAPTLAIGITAVYNYLSDIGDGKVRCGTEKTIYNCYRNCKVTTVEQALNCTPTSLVNLTTDGHTITECTIEKLIEWNGNMSGLEACISKCLNPCRDWRMEATANVFDDWEVGSDKFWIALNIAVASYAEYEEKFAWTLENFVGNLGGVLGLWLGLDLLVAAHILLWPIRFIWYICSHQKPQPPNISTLKAKSARSTSASVVETEASINMHYNQQMGELMKLMEKIQTENHHLRQKMERIQCENEQSHLDVRRMKEEYTKLEQQAERI